MANDKINSNHEMKTNEVKIKIGKISRNQEATIKIANNDNKELIEKITNETIKLSVERAENESYDVKYEIIKRDYNRSTI